MTDRAREDDVGVLDSDDRFNIAHRSVRELPPEFHLRERRVPRWSAQIDDRTLATGVSAAVVR
ncbi:hypothetical protein [Halorubrum sp. Ea8]|uniref:hypothetical protein n=1 Tax=Halorubrum sp. Ea8 TaxID=1383841 RepID=UPI001595ED1D|nr:hypothetical protein [Halorubrum sp. Ea8]